MQQQFFSAATGGPVPYSGHPLHEVHKHLGISRRELKRFTDILIETLEKHDIDEQDALDIVARTNIYADEITNDLPDYG
jgi:truncated hemoglobin YjbI